MADKKAFTLIESLFTLSLICLIAVAFLTSLIVSVNYVRKSYELRTSSLILQEQMSILRERSYDEVQALGGSFSSVYMPALTNASGVINKAPYGGQADILKITYTLNWTTFDNRPASRSVVTMITNQGLDKK